MVGLYNIIVYCFLGLHWKGLVGPLHIVYCPNLNTILIFNDSKEEKFLKAIHCELFVVFVYFLTLLKSGSQTQKFASQFMFLLARLKEIIKTHSF